MFAHRLQKQTLLLDAYIDKSYDFLKNKLGLKHLTETDKNLASLALGGCVYGMTTTESAGAYAIFGNNGVYHKPTTYYKVERVNGEVVLEYDETGEQVISPASATIMNHLLQEVVYGSEGTGSGIRYYSTMKAYAKTGTSSESKDLWMVAGTPYYVGSVWYGFDMQQEIKSTSGAANIWKDVMKEVHKGLEKKNFVDSEDVYKKGSGYYKNGTKPDNLVYSSGSTSSTQSTTEAPPTVSSTPSESSSEGTTSSTTSSGTTSDSSAGDTSSGTTTESETPVTPPEPPTPSAPEPPTPPTDS